MKSIQASRIAVSEKMHLSSGSFPARVGAVRVHHTTVPAVLAIAPPVLDAEHLDDQPLRRELKVVVVVDPARDAATLGCGIVGGVRRQSLVHAWLVHDLSPL